VVWCPEAFRFLEGQQRQRIGYWGSAGSKIIMWHFDSIKYE